MIRSVNSQILRRGPPGAGYLDVRDVERGRNPTLPDLRPLRSGARL